MSKRIGLVVVVAAMIAALVVPTAAFAQSATNTAWTSSITYYTPSDAPGTLIVSFYAEGSATSIDLPAITLSPHAAGSIVVGGVSSLAAGFKGSAVLSSDVYVVATAVQYAAGSDNNNYGRMLYSGFSGADGAPTVYIATVLKQSTGSTSTIAVQNTESFDANVNVKFYAVGNPTPVKDLNFTIKAQSDLILGGGTNAGNISLPTPFSGSAVLTGTKLGDTNTQARLVASAQETDDNGRGAYAFEGVASGAKTIFMPSMLCNYNSPHNQTSYYAIQNTDLTTPTNITIVYYDTTGTKLATTNPVQVAGGGKLPANPCQMNLTGKNGSAVIKSDATNIIAIGKIKASNGMATAFVGAPAGAKKVAAPYVRWAATPSSEWRSYIAVMNVGAGPASNIVAKYYDGKGVLKGQQTLATPSSQLNQFIKAGTNPQSAGALTALGQFGINENNNPPAGGSIEITSDQDILVVVRSQKVVSLGTTTMFAEDYNAVPIP